MAKNLKNLAGRPLSFIDENNTPYSGTLMYLEGFNNPFMFGDQNYFFVPSDSSKPFKISSNGLNKIKVSRDHTEIYGHSKSISNTANDDELKELFLFEGLMRWSDPFRDVCGLGGPMLIQPPINASQKGSKPNFQEGFMIG